GGDSTIAPITGNIEASVLPPAVGASTTAFLPSRMASPASSWTRRSDGKLSVCAIACCRRSGNREKTLIASSHLDGRAAEAVVVGRRGFVELPAGEDRGLLGRRIARGEAEELVGVGVVTVDEHIQDVHEGP